MGYRAKPKSVRAAELTRVLAGVQQYPEGVTALELEKRTDTPPIMPIKAENKNRYPANWREIRAEILKRAGNCCEFCGRPNHVWAVRDGAWRWTKDEMEAIARPNERVFLLVLTIAHLDHNPENNDGMDYGAPAIPTYRIEESNLRALCQRCHLAWDANHHKQTAYRTRRNGKAAGDLFDAHP